jgi:hypothetical protein
MKKLPNNFEYDSYGIHCRFVCEDDAEFIVQLRTNPILSRFIHSTENSVQKQREWIRQYKQREALGKDYYFIYFKGDEPIGVNRLYNIDEKSATSGSWICRPNVEGVASILIEIILRHILFDIMGAEFDHFDVRIENKRVRCFTEMCGAKLVSENDLDAFYKLTVEDYKKSRIYRSFCVSKQPSNPHVD